MIIKCKMCGGDIQFNPGDTCGQCDHCGCTTTFPKLPDEQRANLFNRANHFRRQCEFDKAVAAYEHILEVDETDAEAHWGIVLSKFGIEYVEDPVTHERIPTCHRAQVISILSDEDYQNALKFAPDTQSREIYETEAKRIAEIQKGILAISSREKPYDVFICYKETDDNGSRTKDSTLAQEIYYQLTNEGYKVFFSRITLEDKLGQEYEPYIFAALNSAKVMLVVGTKPENFSAVWVKNEWSRFLAIMKNDRQRVLIPCYRDMDPYDLPEELSALQSQDMSKIGFVQDLIRGIKKIVSKDGKSDSNKSAKDTSQSSAAPLLRRAYMFLEDGEWDSANEYAEKVLDLEPENARAYLVKLMIERGAHTEDELVKLGDPLTKTANYSKVMRFADDELKEKLKSWNQQILDWNERYRKIRIRDGAISTIREASSVAQCLEAKANLKLIEGFEGVEDAVEQCDAKIESIKNGIYSQAIELMKAGKWENAISVFKTISEYKDSSEQIKRCEEKIYEEKYEKAEKLKNNGKYSEAIEAFRAISQYRDSIQQIEACKSAQEAKERAIEEEKRKQQELAERKAREIAAKKKKKTIISVVAAIVAVAAIIIVTQVIIPSSKYHEAENLIKEKKYEEASAMFEELGDYSDSASRIYEPFYVQGEDAYNSGDYQQAYEALIKALSFENVPDRVKTRMYTFGQSMYEKQEYTLAIDAMKAIDGFEDASAKWKEYSYEYGMKCYNEGKNALAIIPLACSGKPEGEALADELRASFENRVVCSGGIYAIKEDGSVLAMGNNEKGFFNVSSWKDIVKIAPGTFHVVALKSDGTLVVIFDSYIKWTDPSQMENWRGVADVITDHMRTIALHSDGTCSFFNARSLKDEGVTYDLSNWTNIVRITSSDYNVAGLRSDGTVLDTGDNSHEQKSNVSSFRNIKQIAMGTWKMMGLTQEGSILYSGWTDYGEASVKSWTGIKKIINGGSFYSVGLKKDGTVVATSNFEDYLTENKRWTSTAVSGWRDIVDIVCYPGSTNDLVAGLKKDGTVVLAGNIYELQKAGYENLTENWKNVICIYPGLGGIVGLKSDGSLLYIGTSEYVKQETVEGWHLW